MVQHHEVHAADAPQVGDLRYEVLAVQGAEVVIEPHAPVDYLRFAFRPLIGRDDRRLISQATKRDITVDSNVGLSGLTVFLFEEDVADLLLMLDLQPVGPLSCEGGFSDAASGCEKSKLGPKTEEHVLKLRVRHGDASGHCLHDVIEANVLPGKYSIRTVDGGVPEAFRDTRNTVLAKR